MRSLSPLFVLVVGFLLPACLLGQANGQLRGVVTLKMNGEPLQHATVSIIELGRDAHTDPEGRFEFAEIPPGTYTVSAHRHQLTTERQEVEIIAGQAAGLDFALTLAPLTEEVTVTASAREKSTFESFQTVTSLSVFELSENSEGTVGEVLENQPGVAKRSFGPGSSRPVIRGFDGDRVLILQDGVRTGALSSQSGDHGEPIDPTSLERLEVIKGPATLLYGSNALGGVVNAITSHHQIHEHPHPGLRGHLSGVGGFANAQGGTSGEIEYGSGRWLAQLGGGARRSGNYNTPIGVIQNSGSRVTSTSGRLGWFAEKKFASFGYNYEDGRHGVPFAGQLAGGIGEIELDFRRHNARFTGGFRNLDSFIESVRLNLNYSDWQHKELEDNVVGTVFDNDQLVFRGTFEQRKTGPLSGSLGFWGMRRDYEASGEEALAPPTTQDAIAVFGYEELDFDKLRLQFGARIERNAYKPQVLTARSFTGVSASAGIRVPVARNTVVVANFSRSYRAPALEELYNFGPHVGILAFEIGNPDLRREAARGVEVSLRHRSGPLRGELNLFHYDFDDFVFLAPTGAIVDGLTAAQYLQQDSRFLGGEAGVDFRLHPKVRIKLGMDYVDAQLTPSGTPLPRIPPLRGRVGFALQHKSLNVKPELILASDQNQHFSTETRTAGYTVINVKASYTVARTNLAHIFAVNAFNLGNRLYRNHLSFIKDLAPEIGRGIRFTYSVRFF